MTGVTHFSQRLSAMLLTALFFLSVRPAFAQNVIVKTVDSSDRRYNHLIGLQLNELIRQVFNYDKNSVTNPYLLTYELVSRQNQFGLRTGIGVNYSRQMFHGLYLDTTQTSLDVHFRVGASKTFRLYRKFIAGVGVDMVYNYQKIDNKQEDNQPLVHSSNVNGLDNTVTSELWGGGPEISLKYQFSDKIAVGTELQVQVLSGKKRNKTVYSYSSADDTRTSSIDQRVINLPTVFYIILKL